MTLPMLVRCNWTVAERQSAGERRESGRRFPRGLRVMKIIRTRVCRVGDERRCVWRGRSPESHGEGLWRRWRMNVRYLQEASGIISPSLFRARPPSGGGDDGDPISLWKRFSYPV